MPVTSVGQLPSPSGTDKPNIPTDLKNLASVTDAWVSGLDNTLDTRVKAVGTRLDGAVSRITAVTGGLSTASSNMTVGDAAITSAQNAMTAAELRLNTQDATAGALQGRYNADNAALNTISQGNPLGLTASWDSASSAASSNTAVHWIATTYVVLNSMPNPMWRMQFNVQAETSGSIELRLCCSTATLNFNRYFQQAFLGSPDSSNYFEIPMLAVAYPGAIGNGTAVWFGLGVKGGGGSYEAHISGGNIQFLQTGY